jgi:hypothetical protein
MALEDLEARLAFLLTSIEESPEDLHELHDLVQQKLEQMKAMGLPLPDDLVSLQQRLEARFGEAEA